MYFAGNKTDIYTCTIFTFNNSGFKEFSLI